MLDTYTIIFNVCVLALIIVSNILLLFVVRFKIVKKVKQQSKVKPYISQEMVTFDQLELREDAISEDMNDVAKRFIDYFEKDKPYLNPDIRIMDVAEHLFTNKTYLSRAINIKFGKNFSQLVHWFRIRDAVSIYIESGNMSMQELHLKVGFRSMSTFNTAFSRYTGKTPADWCKSIKKVEQNG